MHYTDERAHPNRTETPFKSMLYDMLLNKYPYTAAVLARMLIEHATEADIKAFMKQHNLKTDNVEVL